MKKRIDSLLVELGLAASRERAQSLILSGNVLINDIPVTKAGLKIEEGSSVRVRGGEDHPYVSRGGVKLAAALDRFRISAVGRIALDVGASTGGFTQVLLMRGISRVFAVDVGRNQMDWKIRSDSRVAVHEKVNARHLEFSLIGQKVDIITVDVSFISLEKVLPALLQFSHPETDWITLIKPQFEVGRGQVGKGGVVTSDQARSSAIRRLVEFGETLGLKLMQQVESIITGTQGNREYFAHWKLGPI